MQYLFRIRRVYFDQIKAGTKTTEYRAAIGSYRWLERVATNAEIRFQCGPYLSLTKIIDSVEKIETPEEFRDADWCRGCSEVYAIHLK